tara:strand:+ start:290 stop:469 length:180 start_codon:yes stop_codon:yes gene_type:complete
VITPGPTARPILAEGGRLSGRGIWRAFFIPALTGILASFTRWSIGQRIGACRVSSRRDR